MTKIKKIKYFLVSLLAINSLTMAVIVILDVKDFFESDFNPEVVTVIKKEKIYMHQFGTVADPYREDLHGQVECSCVRTVRSFGVTIPYGINTPMSLEPNVAEIDGKSIIGSIALFTTKDGLGHMALVTDAWFVGDKIGFFIKEGNYEKCKMTERFVSFEDYRLRGFYNIKK